jgi:hypothetical protein
VRRWQRRGVERGRRRRSNARGATAAVTQYGCGRGEFFGGCERASRGVAATGSGRPPSGGGAESASARKRGEPQDWQRDATSPRTSERRKPPRWCETTRAERDGEGWLPRRRSRAERRGGSGRTEAMSVEGRRGCALARARRIPGEAVHPDRGGTGALWRGAKTRRVLALAVLRNGIGAGRFGRPRGPAGDGEGRGGSGEGQTTRYEASAGKDDETGNGSGVFPRTLKVA